MFQLNFLVQKEILAAKTTKSRAEILAHFIKIAKVSAKMSNDYFQQLFDPTDR